MWKLPRLEVGGVGGLLVWVLHVCFTSRALAWPCLLYLFGELLDMGSTRVCVRVCSWPVGITADGLGDVLDGGR